MSKEKLIIGAVILFVIFLIVRKKIKENRIKKGKIGSHEIVKEDVRESFDAKSMANLIFKKFATFGSFTDARIELMIEISYLSDSEMILLNKEMYNLHKETLRERLENAWVFIDPTGYYDKVFSKLDELKL